jgi:catechol-2,3-dioxygenase
MLFASQVTATDLTYVMVQAADLNALEVFMTDFGLHTVKKSSTDLWMGAGNSSPYVYHAKLGNQTKFLGAGFKVNHRDDLEALAKRFGEANHIETIEEPGGGFRLRMIMPDGFLIDAVANQTPSTASTQFDIQEPLNFLATKGRVNRSVRIAAGAKPVRRLGHFVLHVSNHDESVKWLSERFGLIPSDYFGTTDEPPHIFGTFLRVDAGTKTVDHHCLLVLQSERVSSHHISFEMTGLDDLMCAHDFLVEKGYQLDVGVGRHMLGSQIFDYWKDPSGFRVEHYTDGDVVNHDHRPEIFTGTADETTQWGARPDAKFFE